MVLVEILSEFAQLVTTIFFQLEINHLIQQPSEEN
jgi:hypothetical protein